MSETSQLNANRRAFTRVIVPKNVTIAAKLFPEVSHLDVLSGYVSDLSPGGLSLRLRGTPVYPLHAEQAFTVVLEYEGLTVRMPCSIVRHHAVDVSLRFPFTEPDLSDPNGLLLWTLIMRVVTSELDVTRPSDFQGLQYPPVFTRYHHPGYLDVRVQRTAPRWCQFVFLEFYVEWTEDRGITTGVIRARERSDRNAPALTELARRIARRCSELSPEAEDDFSFALEVLGK